MDRLELLSPTNGRPLRTLGANLLDDGDCRWPVVEGIAYLRPKESVRVPAVAAIEAGDVRQASVILLRDQDDYSPTAPPGEDEVLGMLDTPPATLRGAMQALNYGPVGDYFAYRWCSPTFLSGLRLLEMAVPEAGLTVECACGIGHFLREIELAGNPTVGVDIVYSKLWLARRYLDVRGTLICGDVEQGPVIGGGGPRTVFCHDAFYFLRRKRAALDHMRQMAGAGGRIAIGHVHTDRDAHRAGEPRSAAEYRDCTPAVVWDDAGLADDFFRRSGESPRQATDESRAVAWLEGGRLAAQEIHLNKFRGQDSLNPLLSGDKINWPSQGWKDEFLADIGRMEVSPLDRWRAYSRQPARAVDPGASGYSPDELVAEGLLLNLPDRW